MQGFPILYFKDMRIMMFQLSSFYFRKPTDLLKTETFHTELEHLIIPNPGVHIDIAQLPTYSKSRDQTAPTLRLWSKGPNN